MERQGGAFEREAGQQPRHGMRPGNRKGRGEENTCAYLYWGGGVPRPELVCPNETTFTVRLARQRAEDGCQACIEHLPYVVWDLMLDLGAWGEELVVTMARLTTAAEAEAADARAAPPQGE